MFDYGKYMNAVTTKILLTKFNHEREVHQITEICLHSDGGVQTKCVPKLSRGVDITSVDHMRPADRGLLINCSIEESTPETSFGA